MYAKTGGKPLFLQVKFYRREAAGFYNMLKYIKMSVIRMYFKKKKKGPGVVTLHYKRHKERRIKRTILGIFLLAMCFAAGWFFIFSDAIKVKEITVIPGVLSNADMVKTATINAVTPHNFLNQIINNDNLLVWGSRTITLDAKKFPMIESVIIKRDIFKRTVQLTVVEKERKFIFCEKFGEAMGKCFWIDASGDVIGEAPYIKSKLFPVVMVADTASAPLFVGGSAIVASQTAVLDDVVSLLDRLSLPADSITIRKRALRECEVQIAKGPLFYFSLENDPGAYDSVVMSLMNEGLWSKISYVDLRVPGRMYYALIK